jgi:hypothetical protein
LPLRSRRKSEENYVFRADAKGCDACPVKGECTGSKSGRHIFRSFHQEYIDKVKAYHKAEVYKKASRKRSVWVEPLFGEAKDFHRLRRFRLRGLHKVNIEEMMIAAGQNLKRLIKHCLEKLCFLAKDLISCLFPIEASTFSTACCVVRRWTSSACGQTVAAKISFFARVGVGGVSLCRVTRDVYRMLKNQARCGTFCPYP